MAHPRADQGHRCLVVGVDRRHTDKVRSRRVVMSSILAVLLVGSPQIRAKVATEADPAKDELANLGCLLRVMTLMEDTITACALQTHGNHPMNLGWSNLFARWAT